MAKPRTMKGRKETRKIRDLTVKPAAIARVKGGSRTGQHHGKIDIHI
jgi:hypothetical protein